ncbi:hypothetical protein ACFWNQ_24870 [Streptomyces virginiae]|uniref:hypothetical protein n=1 Tax=Streptomyces virginiae TaxID=1961 RepID=UPI00365179C3
MRGLLAVLRSLSPGQPVVGVPAPLIALPMDVEPGEFARCPAEERIRYHAVQANGARRCWTCNWITEAGA